jgi:hypothetical protein
MNVILFCEYPQDKESVLVRNVGTRKPIYTSNVASYNTFNGESALQGTESSESMVQFAINLKMEHFIQINTS